jgi:Integrase core domain
VDLDFDRVVTEEDRDGADQRRVLTVLALIASSRHLDGPGSSTTVVVDSGIENVNQAVDATLVSTCLRRVLAQVEVSYSNSMVEAWWRSLKHQWLFLNSLDTIDRLRTLVAFFVEAHNTQMPHAAFAGHTPDEIYLGMAPNLAAELAVTRTAARERRLAANRSAREAITGADQRRVLPVRAGGCSATSQTPRTHGPRASNRGNDSQNFITAEPRVRKNRNNIVELNGIEPSAS